MGDNFAIKFYKDAIPDILSGNKTLEPRPRSSSWIKKVQDADLADFTYGPRFHKPTVFAQARITQVQLRPFETATPDDLQLIGLGWAEREVEDFIEEYRDWFSKELSKGYEVAWIYFQVVEKIPPQ